jgi:hypothetical protein
MANESIFKQVDDLPQSNITTRVLDALDRVVPGEWQNTTSFEEMIRLVSGEKDEAMIQRIGERAIRLYNDRSQGYQRAIWLYRTVDNVDTNLAKLALVNMVGGKVRFLSFLDRFTPKADKLQVLDLSLKLVAEMAAFCLVNGIPGDSLGDFVKSLHQYSRESRLRMVALIALDGLVPLGTDFIEMVTRLLDNLGPGDLEDNKLYQRIQEFIPGRSSAEKLAFTEKTFGESKGWMQGVVKDNQLTREKVVSSIERFVDFSEGKFDALAAFLDMTTNYYEHTGTQTVARRLIERAVNEI